MTTMDPNQNTNAHPDDATADATAAAQGQRPDRSGVETRLHRLQRLVRRRRHEQRGPRGAGPFGDATRGRGRVIAALQMQSPIPTRELAYLLDIRQQSLNELLKKLEGDGLVERTPSEKDKRVMLVSLTDAGRAAEVGRGRADYLTVLTDEEAAQLAGLLDKIIDSLEAELGVAADEDPADWQAEARRRMGDDRFEAMMRMREEGFGPRRFGPGPFGRDGGPDGGPHGHHDGPHGHHGRHGERDDHEGGPRGGRGAHRGSWEPDGGPLGEGGAHDGRRRGQLGPGLPGGEIPERGAREFRGGRRGRGDRGRGFGRQGRSGLEGWGERA